MRSTLVGIFENRPAAERARSELLRAGFADDEVDLRTGTEDRDWRRSDDRSAYEDESESTIGETVADWFRSLFGIDDDDDDLGIYTEAMRRGESVVTVRTADGDRVDRASDILEACGSIDIDEKADEWQAQGWTRPAAARDASGGSKTTPPTSSTSSTSSAPLGATAASAAAMGAASMRDAGDRKVANGRGAQGSQDRLPAADVHTGNGVHPTGSVQAGEELRAGESKRIPVIEEQLRVGKRIVGRRRLRVYTQMVDEPVREDVHLAEERVRIDRHDADRPATEADYRAAQAGAIEATESSEEPVVDKHARVVGEVEIGKERNERQETVRDTVRHTNVEVRKLDEAGRTTGAATTPTNPDGTRANGSGTPPAEDPRPGDAPPPPDVRR